MRDETGCGEDRRWWLEPGAETCAFCLQPYQIEIAYYCVVCDEPVCPNCVDRPAEREVLCPRCAAERGTS